MARQIKRLEHALYAWEDYWFCLNATSKLQRATGQRLGMNIVPHIGPVKHFMELRKHLLKIRSAEQFDFEKFLLPTEVSQTLSTNWPRLMSHFPAEMALWICESRRVFRITRELQVLLGATLLGDIRWCDMHWPFDAFVVMLDIPIKSSFDCEYDCILVSRYCMPDDPEGVIAFRLFSTALDDQQRVISPIKQRRISGLIQEKKWQEASALLANHRLPRLPVDPFFVKANEQSKVVESMAEISCGYKLSDVEAPQWDIAAQLVVGLCLYMNTLPPKSSHKSDWNPALKSLGRPNPNSVTDAAQICTISSTFKLRKEDSELIGINGTTRAFHEICAHFRRGHWRRRPGQGQDPNAPRAVWVRPTLVRRDRLQDGAIVGGSENIVS